MCCSRRRGPGGWFLLRCVPRRPASATPQREDRLFPGDIAQFILRSPGLAHGAAGVLYALHQAGRMSTSDAAYQRGVKYLLSSQFPDGSWHVKSRAVKFQPYFESGFPHGHDQWISAAGTAWAASALALAAETAKARVQ